MSPRQETHSLVAVDQLEGRERPLDGPAALASCPTLTTMLLASYFIGLCKSKQPASHDTGRPDAARQKVALSTSLCEARPVPRQAQGDHEGRLVLLTSCARVHKPRAPPGAVARNAATAEWCRTERPNCERGLGRPLVVQLVFAALCEPPARPTEHATNKVLNQNLNKRANGAR